MMASKELLQDLYINKKLSTLEISKQTKISKSWVVQLLHRYSIPFRTRAEINNLATPRAKKLNYDEIRELYEIDKLSCIEIANKLGYTVSGTKSALRNMGIKFRSLGGNRTLNLFGFVPTRKSLEQLMVEHNYNAVSVAQSIGIKYNTFVGWLKKFEIPRKGRQDFTSKIRQEIPIEEAIKLSDQGWTYQQLADKYKVSYGVVMRRLKETGYSPPWRRIADERFKTVSYHKRKIFKELNIISCEICGEERALDFCHIVATKDGGPTEKNNTLILCPLHHRLFDTNSLTTEEFTLIKDKITTAKELYSQINKCYANY